MTRTIDAIYAAIPKVSGCLTGCADCCGPVPMLKREAARIKTIMPPLPRGDGTMVTPTKPGCITCAYSTAAECSIYETRPFMCRLYGAVVGEPQLECPHGAKAERPLTKAQADALAMEYMGIGQ